MLPGIRFLLAAIVLSTSLLIFGLGAAALLRAAHEDVANVPVRRVMAEPVFAPRQEVATLAMLRVETTERGKTPDSSPPSAMSLAEPSSERVAEPKAEPDLAAPKQDETAAAETPAPASVVTAELAPAETRLAALDTEPVTPAGNAPVAVEPSVAPAIEAERPAVKTVALGEPTATADATNEAKKASENPDRAEIRRKKRAERARERRRQAARRAKLAAQQAAAQQAIDPFSQVMQPTQPAVTTPVRRRQ